MLPEQCGSLSECGWLTVSFVTFTLLLRPRINKLDSVKDREQKASGNYFFMEGGEGGNNIG